MDSLTINVSGAIFSIDKKSLIVSTSKVLSHLLRYESESLQCSTSTVSLPSGILRVNDCFFVQRSPKLFDVILEQTLTGKLHIPHHICKDLVLKELKFWQINVKNVPLCSCCRDDWEDENSNSSSSQNEENSSIKTPIDKFRNQVWNITENNENTWRSLLFTYCSLFFIFTSTANLIVGSLPQLQYCEITNTTIVESITDDFFDPEEDSKLNLTTANSFFSECRGTMVFEMIDAICVLWFTLELSLRLLSCPSIVEFIKTPLNIIDILSIVPFYIEVIVWVGTVDSIHSYGASKILVVFRILRTLRVLRVLKLARYVEALRVLGFTIRSAKSEMTMLVIFVITSALIFGTLEYHLEKDFVDSKYNSIPASCWWSFVTLTTVGYGDVTPQSIGGKLVGGVACVTGILVISLPVSVLVEHFTSAYKRAKSRHIIKEAMKRRDSKD